MLISKKRTPKKAKLRYAEYYNLTEVFDSLYNDSKNGRTFTKLMNIIVSPSNIKLAFRSIKSNSGSNTPGIDKRDISYISRMPEERYVEIMTSKFNSYNPSAVKRVEIPKSDGRTRPLGIPTIWDRLIQQCILQVLEPICEAKFHERSNGFRPNRSAENAIAQCYKMINQYHLPYVVDFDITGFFDNVNHCKLRKQLWGLGIQDKQLLCIIKKILKAPIQMPDGKIVIPTKGTPQGGILSPLLANVYLNELDWWVTSQWETFPSRHTYAGKTNPDGSVQQSAKYNALRKTKLKEMYIVRYADDFKIFCRSYNDAKRAFESTKHWLNERLKLEVNPEKSKIVNLRTNYSDFLGFRIKAITKNKKLKVMSHVSDKAIDKMTKSLTNQIDKIKTPRNSEDEYFEIRLYNSLVVGYHNYYQFATMASIDFNIVHSRLRFVIHNRLSHRLSTKGQLTNKFIAERYGDSRCMRYIRGFPLIPISYVQHKSPMYKRNAICSYTKEGREAIHKSLGVNQGILLKLMRERNTNNSVEFMDNRLSLYCAQQGKCAVLGTPLKFEEIHCHHRLPKKNGGKDNYSNLIIIQKDIHQLIHAVTDETIAILMKSLNLNKVQLQKVNRLRDKAGLPSIAKSSYI